MWAHSQRPCGQIENFWAHAMPDAAGLVRPIGVKEPYFHFPVNSWGMLTSRGRNFSCVGRMKQRQYSAARGSPRQWPVPKTMKSGATSLLPPAYLRQLYNLTTTTDKDFLAFRATAVGLHQGLLFGILCRLKGPLPEASIGGLLHVVRMTVACCVGG